MSDVSVLHRYYQAGSGANSSWCILAPEERCWWSRLKCQPPQAWQRHHSQRTPCGKRVSVVSATSASIPRRGHIVAFVSDCIDPLSTTLLTQAQLSLFNNLLAIPHESSKRYGQLEENREQGTRNMVLVPKSRFGRPYPLPSSCGMI